MSSNRNAFHLGLVLLTFLALGIGVLVFLAPRGRGDFDLLVRFPHHQVTTTLIAGSEVVCGGMTVGKVKSITLQEMQDPADGRPELFTVAAVRVQSSIDLREDCRIAPEGPLLGGAGRLVILDRGLGRTLTAGQTVEGQVAADFAGLTRMLAAQLDVRDPTSLLAVLKSQLDASDPGSLLAKIHTSLSDINAVTTSIRAEFDPGQRAALLAKLHSILDNVNVMTCLLRGEVDRSSDLALVARVHAALDRLDRGLATVVELLEDNREPITETITNVRNTSRILETQIAARIAAQLDTAQAAGLLAKVHVAVDRLGGSIEDMNVITAEARQTVVLNRDGVNAIVANFKETSDHLKAASKEIRRNPWRLFYQPTIEEAEQANVFDAARAFAEAATRLDDALLRVQALSQAGGTPVGDKQLTLIRDQLQQTFSQFNRAEAALFEQLKIRK